MHPRVSSLNGILVFVYMLQVKDVPLLADSLDVQRTFSERARRMAGFQLDRVQRGLEPFDWTPMPAIGPGVQ